MIGKHNNGIQAHTRRCYRIAGTGDYHPRHNFTTMNDDKLPLNDEGRWGYASSENVRRAVAGETKAQTSPQFFRNLMWSRGSFPSSG